MPMLKNKGMMAVLIAGLAIIFAIIIIKQGEKTMPPPPNKTTENDFVIFAKYEASNHLDPKGLKPLYLNTYLYNSGKLIKEGNFYEGRRNLEKQIDEKRMEKIRVLVKQIIERKECSDGQPLPSGSLNYLLRFNRQEKRLIGLTTCDAELGEIMEEVIK